MCCKQNQKKGSFCNSKLPATSCARPAAAAQSQFPIPSTCHTPLPLMQCNAESTTASLFPGCRCCPARRHFCSAEQTNWRTDMDGASDWLGLLLLPLPIGICRINTAAAQAASEQRRASFTPATTITTTTNKALPTKQFLVVVVVTFINIILVAV